jgi:hypothetical protein
MLIDLNYSVTGLIILLIFYTVFGLWYWFDLSIYIKRKRINFTGPIICNYCNSKKTMTFKKCIRIDYPSIYGCCHECYKTWRIT